MWASWDGFLINLLVPIPAGIALLHGLRENLDYSVEIGWDLRQPRFDGEERPSEGSDGRRQGNEGPSMAAIRIK